VSVARIRIQRSDIPDQPTPCAWPNACVYRKDGVCDEPRTNKGNSDAACNRMTNKQLLIYLEAKR
jgi:hypothetical protein